MRPNQIPAMYLTDRVAIVTGAGRGFGAAIATRLAQAGAAVVVADIDCDLAERTARRITDQTTVKATAEFVDVTDEASITALMRGTAEKIGATSILVNNAGVFSNVLAREMSTGEFRRILDVNVTGYFVVTREFIRHHDPARGATIVNIASVDAVAPSAQGLAHYTTSKHAVAGLTRSLAMELAPQGIRVNAVCPGASITEGAIELVMREAPDGIDVEAQWAGILARTPIGRLCTPEDVANAVLFLASDLASAITGVLLPVDGGILVQPLEGYIS